MGKLSQKGQKNRAFLKHFSIFFILKFFTKFSSFSYTILNALFPIGQIEAASGVSLRLSLAAYQLSTLTINKVSTKFTDAKLSKSWARKRPQYEKGFKGPAHCQPQCLQSKNGNLHYRIFSGRYSTFWEKSYLYTTSIYHGLIQSSITAVTMGNLLLMLYQQGTIAHPLILDFLQSLLLLRQRFVAYKIATMPLHCTYTIHYNNAFTAKKIDFYGLAFPSLTRMH